MNNEVQIRIIETLVVSGLAVISMLLGRFTFAKIGARYNYPSDRIRFAQKLVKLFVLLPAIISILFVWGVDQTELAVFLSSFAALLGIAFFAQWSMLSNVTASILLFLTHPAKVGDTITILDKDYSISGTITDVGAFFIRMKTEDQETLTFPNSLLFQKMVKVSSAAVK